MLDAFYKVWLDPILEQTARELGYVRPQCEQNPHEQTNPRENKEE